MLSCAASALSVICKGGFWLQRDVRVFGCGGSRVSVILVVEDDEQVRVLVESMLRDAGYEVLAATALEGAQALLNSDQSIDLLFVDVHLGGDLEAGLRIGQSARERRARFPRGSTPGHR